MKRNNKKGFTIVELVVVIAVIAILAAVLIPTFSGITTKAKQSAAIQEAKNAYTETLADDLYDNDTTNDLVYNKTVIVTHNGFLIQFNASGQPSIVTSGTATLKVSAGKLVANS